MAPEPEDVEVPEGIQWVPAPDASEEEAVVAGLDEEGNQVRVARVKQGAECGTASLIAGSVEARLAFFGKTVLSADFDLLITSSPVRWVLTEHGKVPPGAIPAGRDERGDIIFVARVVIKGCAWPAKLLSRFHGAFAAFDMLEFFRRRHEVLCICADGDDADATDPHSPPETGDLTDCHEEDDLNDDRRDQIEVPDGLAWKYAVDGETFDNAVSAGEDCEGRPLHVVRGTEEWELASGVLIVGDCTASIPYYGIGSKRDRYEVLVNEGDISLIWVRASCGRVPRNAVACGINRKEHLMYVARIRIEDEVMPGKLNATMKRAYAAKDGREYVRAKYEVLCVDDGEGMEGEEEEEEAGEVDDGGRCDEDSRKDEVPALDGIEWVTEKDGRIPDGAVIVDGKGSARVYVARSSEEEELVTGGVSKGAPAAVPYYEVALNSCKYEVMTVTDDEVQLFWVPACGGEVPEGAVQGGVSSSGDAIYVARAKPECTCDDVYSAGKVRAGFDTGYFAYNCDEVACVEYEVLVYGADAECLDGARRARVRKSHC